MSKQELVEYLINAGYKAELDNDGVVMVLVPKTLNIREHRKLAKVINETKFSSSWGWRAEKSTV